MGASILGGWDKSLTLNIKSEQNEFSELRILSCSLFLSNLSILKIYNIEFLKSKSFFSSLFILVDWEDFALLVIQDLSMTIQDLDEKN